MLERFLTPRWQHADPKVRREAVKALSASEDGEALARVARDDALPAIRRLALRQVRDLSLLEERAGEDADETVREQASRRIHELLSGLDEAGPPLAERLQRAERCDDPALIEFLAREAREDALRACALSRVERETVLRDVALGDASPELRLEALARIQDEGLLARVYERSRKTDKRVSHAARERLDALREARERPQQVAAESARLCDTLEALGHDGHFERDAGRLVELEQRWQDLDAALREPFAARYTAARERFEKELAAYRTTTGTLRAEREAVIERLERLCDAPAADAGDAIEAWITSRAEALAEARAAWESGTPLPSVDEQPLEARFEHAAAALREAVNRERTRSTLQRLLTEHQRLAARKGAVPESDVKALGRAVEELPGSDGQDAALGALARLVDKAHARLRERLRRQADWKRDTLAGLDERLAALKTIVTEGKAGEAGAAYDAIAADLEQLLTAGTSTERLAKPRKRLEALAKDIGIMRAWGRAGARAAAERLCEQMEALKGSQEAPPAIADKVREARAAWKALAKSGDGVSKALWRRFDTAATEAYLPCKAYFDERDTARKANLERRRALLAELDGFLASAGGGPDMDWKGAVRFRRELLKGWHAAHPVPRGSGKALATELDAGMARLDGLLGRERERSLRQREQLIGEAEALAASDDKKAAAEACKRLQRQWSVTVPGSRKDENALWERFRGACDAVFTERQQVFDAERVSIKAELGQREALCQRVEALLDTGAEAMEEVARELRRIQGEWSRSAPLPRRQGEALDKRFTDAVRRLARHQRALETGRQRAALELLRTKAALCHEAECRSGEGSTANPQAVAALEERWQTLSPLPSPDDEAALAQRFAQAIAGDTDTSTLADNLAARESLCLRLEILAGVDSPPEYSAARMAMQVERLASALEARSQAGGETPEVLLRTWCTTGPAPCEQAVVMEKRFEGAWRALHSGTPDEGASA